MLDSLRERTSGADDEIVTMMSKLDRGELRWTGPLPTRGTRKKARKRRG